MTRFRIGTVSAIALGAVLVLTGSALAAPRTAPVFGEAGPVDGAWSRYVGNPAGGSFQFHTSDLPAGDALTIWWVIFNNPTACTDTSFGTNCGEGDLFNEAVQASMLWGDGHIVAPNGKHTFQGHLGVGDTSEAVFGPGLVNPEGAEIILVIRDHGPAREDIVDEQLSTFDVCDPECVDIQFSFLTV